MTVTQQPEPVRVAARTAIAGIGMTSIGGRVELAMIPPQPRKMIGVPAKPKAEPPEPESQKEFRERMAERHPWYV